MGRPRKESKQLQALKEQGQSDAYLHRICQELQCADRELLAQLQLLQLHWGAGEAIAGRDHQQAQQLIRRAQRSVIGISCLHDDLLILNQLRTGSSPSAESTFDIKELATEVYRAMLPLADRRKLQFRLQLYGDSNYLLGAEQELKRLLLWLLEIILQCAVGPQVEFFVQARGYDEGQALFYFQILDRGCGLDDADFRALGNPFEDSEIYRAARIRHPLVGLKLFAARELLGRLQGKLSLSSSQRRGTLLGARLWLKLDMLNYPEQIVALDPGLRPLKRARTATSSLKKARFR